MLNDFQPNIRVSISIHVWSIHFANYHATIIHNLIAKQLLKFWYCIVQIEIPLKKIADYAVWYYDSGERDSHQYKMKEFRPILGLFIHLRINCLRLWTFTLWHNQQKSDWKIFKANDSQFHSTVKWTDLFQP